MDTEETQLASDLANLNTPSSARKLIHAETHSTQEKKTGFCLSNVTGRYKVGELVVRGQITKEKDDDDRLSDLNIKVIAYSEDGEIVGNEYDSVDFNENSVIEVFEVKVKCDHEPVKLLVFPLYM